MFSVKHCLEEEGRKIRGLNLVGHHSAFESMVTSNPIITLTTVKLYVPSMMAKLL